MKTAVALLIVLAAAVLSPMTSLAVNPDGRPSITISMGLAHTGWHNTASALGVSVDGPDLTTNAYGPSMDFRIPETESVTLILGGHFSHYSEDLGTTDVTDGNIIVPVQMDQSGNTVGGYFGIRLYFGQAK
jgi:hypothetical protein